MIIICPSGWNFAGGEGIREMYTCVLLGGWGTTAVGYWVYEYMVVMMLDSMRYKGI